MLGALGAAFSPLLGRVFPGNAVSPSPASALCWGFCLPPRETVGPAGFCAHGLGRSFSELVLLGVVASRQPATHQVVFPPEVSGVGAQLGF